MKNIYSGIIDKIEKFQNELDNYAMKLYNIESSDSSTTVEKIKEINLILIDSL